MIRIRRYFLTGLAVLLPIVVTIYLILVIFRFADGLLGKYINEYLKGVLGYRIPGLGILLCLFIILLTGFLFTHLLGKRLFLIKRLFPFLERLFMRFPLVKQIYPATKQIVNFLISKEKPTFKKVVMVEYPRKGLYSVGFVTNEGLKEAQERLKEELLNVFVPNSPGPLTGYFILVPKKEVIFLDISVEEGLKLIVSGGVLNP